MSCSGEAPTENVAHGFRETLPHGKVFCNLAQTKTSVSVGLFQGFHSGIRTQDQEP